MTFAKAVAHVAAAAPALSLGWKIANDLFGADPVAEITHFTGDWALRLLLLCLAMTPLRRISGRSEPVRFRRMLGLWAFFYATLHLATYVILDLGGYWAQIAEDIVKRPFITIGFLAWLLLIPLAVTSTRGMMRRLGRRWAQLHKLVYVIGVLAVLHFWWLVKADVREPLVYAAILGLLFLLRWPRNKLGLRKAPAATGQSSQPGA
ncbi:MAG: protein-methionine-sulfoxide reductase heme-binding subunit MsrQ [Lysobacteraceae bacterium]